jgi:hypothetical protein
MKIKNYTLLVLTILIISACKNTAIVSPLIGKWRVVGYYSSIGGPPVYNAVGKDDKGYVQFNENGIMHSNVYDDYASYSIKDYRTITITNDDSKPNYYATHQYKTYYLAYVIKNDTLTMSPAGPVVCIEGCATRFVRY